MKLPTIISIILAVVVIALAVLWFTERSARHEAVNRSDSVETVFENAISTINEIQASIDSINLGAPGQLIKENKESVQAGLDSRSRALGNLNNIRQKIEADRKRIALLEKQLASAGLKAKGLETLVANLKTSITEKEKAITELGIKMGLLADTLATERKQSAETIATKEARIAEQQTLIQNRERDVNTIYYAVGTRKELLAQHVITLTGGFIGIGRVPVVQKGENDKYTSMNLLDYDTITFPVTKRGYTVLTTQGMDSYTVMKSGSEYDLKVLSPELFRKNKYLVIELK